MFLPVELSEESFPRYPLKDFWREAHSTGAHFAIKIFGKRVRGKGAVAKLFSGICCDCPDKYFFENNPYRRIQMRSAGARDHSLWACP